MPQPPNSEWDLFYQKLRTAKVSITTPRSAVFSALYKSEHTPLSMAELIKQTASFSNRASVYRSVKILEEAGIIRRLQVGWKYRLELSDDFHGHHHHLTCTSCGKVAATRNNPKLENALRQFAAENGYSMSEHQLEIKGTCPDCKKL